MYRIFARCSYFFYSATKKPARLSDRWTKKHQNRRWSLSIPWNSKFRDIAKFQNRTRPIRNWTKSHPPCILIPRECLLPWGSSDRLLDRSLRDRSDVMHRSLILNTFRGNLSGFPQNAFSRTTVFHQWLLDAPILGTVLHHRQSLTEILADRLQVFGIQMQTCQRSLVTSAEAALHGVASRNT